MESMTVLRAALVLGQVDTLARLADRLRVLCEGLLNTYGDIYRWKDIKPTNTDIESVYGALYGVINSANFLLDNVEKVKLNTTSDTELDRLEQYQGEAYFARALAYSELIRCSARLMIMMSRQRKTWVWYSQSIITAMSHRSVPA